MRKELHVWFGRNMRRWDSIDGDLIESYDGLSNAFRVSKNNNEPQDDEVIIHTHNVIFANSRVMEEYGFRLFIHPAIGDRFEITFGKCKNTNREIQPHHDILKLLLSGEFDTDECKVISEDFKEDKNTKEIKRIKPEDFDWDGFQRSEFCIVSNSSQNLLAVLQVLSEKGYYWNASGKSLIEDSVAKDQLLDDIKQESIYIRAGGDLEHGVICDYTYRRHAVMIDFKEDNMKEIKRIKPEDFDWAAFDKGKIAIEVDNEDTNELDKVLSILDKKGYTWIFSSKKITDKDSYTYKSLRSMSIPFYLSVGEFEPYCSNGIVWSGCWTTIKETPVRIDFKEDKNMNVTEIKRVKAKDFDSVAFNRKGFRIVIDSPKDVSKTLQFLHESGYMWGRSKTSLLEDDHMREALLSATKRHPVFIIASFVTPHGILRDIRPSADIPTVELVFEETSNDKIVITNDGKITTATLYSNGKKAGVGTAVCHDDDVFDIYAGARLALERLEKNKKKTDMTDWAKFTKGEVDMRVPKKYIQNFLYRTTNDGLTFKGLMPDWYLKWLTQDGDSIVFSVDCDIEKTPIVVEVIHGDWGRTVNYIPGMK